jgi:putative ABC transport system ATP-binding protein
MLRLFDSLSAQGRTIVVITHEDEVGQHARRVVRMRDGRIIADKLNPPRSAVGVS